VRRYRVEDAAALCAVADDFLVARWMTRAFPHPYTRADADFWVDAASSDIRQRYFAIEVDGVLAGGIGVEPYGGERSGVAAFGYWLGRRYWGRGIGSEAARSLGLRTERRLGEGAGKVWLLVGGETTRLLCGSARRDMRWIAVRTLSVTLQTKLLPHGLE
jgi:hypothetical protein